MPSKRRNKRLLERAERVLQEPIESVDQIEFPPEPPPDLRKINIVKWIKEHIKIVPKGGGLIAFERFWHGQKVIIAEFVKCIKLGLPIRFVILKSRQRGVTTIIRVLDFMMGRFCPNTKGVFMAETKEKAMQLFGDHDKVFAQEMSGPENERITLVGGTVNKSFYRYEAPHRSACYVTKGGRGPAGLMLCRLHGSETAHLEHFDKFLAAAMPTIPKPSITPLTMIVCESTPHDKNHFYHLCQQAMRKESGWTFIFIGWRDDEDARIPLQPGEILSLNEEEAEYQRRYGLSDEQIKWVQNTIRDECAGMWEIFHQEYPIDEVVCFQFSGHPWYVRKMVDALLNRPVDPEFRGHISFDAGDSGLPRITLDHHGPFIVWRLPAPGVKYALGMDVSYGIAHDYTVIFVERLDTHEVVCQYRTNRIQPGEAGPIAYLIGRWYNWALIGVERNGPGIATLTTLNEGHPRYPQMLGGYPHVYFHIRVDRKTSEESVIFGFETTRKSKDLALQRHRESFNAGELEIYSQSLLWQMDGFGFNPKSNMYVENNADPSTKDMNDDDVMAAAIAHFMCDHIQKHGDRDQPLIEEL